MTCGCGCGERAVHSHHIVYRQHLRGGRLDDCRNLLALAKFCHDNHHGRSRTLPLRVLPDEAFAFAAELFGAPRAYEYLRRYYAGDDPRLEALL